MTGERLTAARSYVALGWLAFPLHNGPGCSCGRRCESPGKHPRTPHGLKDATTDQRTIERWWTWWPKANVGIATGAASGLVVLDVDPEHGGAASLARLEEIHGELPPTVESVTGGGGRHILFRHPGSVVQSKVGIAEGLDVRGDGGYIVAPPSVHRNGRAYAWDLGGHPEDVELAPMPAWLFELLAGGRNGQAAAPVPERGSLQASGTPP